MSREHIAPTRTKTESSHDDYEESHPAYATIGAARSQSTGRPLFGSDVAHQHYMTVTIRKARSLRGLNRNYVHGSGEIVEVAMTESQWATFVSTPNMGTGVPCTLEYHSTEGGPGMVPGIIALDTETDRHNAEVDEHLREAQEAVAELLKAIEAGKGKKDLRHLALMAQNAVGANLRFLADSFAEHTEETVEKAKTEFEAWVNAAVTSRGLEALMGPEAEREARLKRIGAVYPEAEAEARRAME